MLPPTQWVNFNTNLLTYSRQRFIDRVSIILMSHTPVLCFHCWWGPISSHICNGRIIFAIKYVCPFIICILYGSPNSPAALFFRFIIVIRVMICCIPFSNQIIWSTIILSCRHRCTSKPPAAPRSDSNSGSIHCITTCAKVYLSIGVVGRWLGRWGRGGFW